MAIEYYIRSANCRKTSSTSCSNKPRRRAEQALERAELLKNICIIIPYVNLILTTSASESINQYSYPWTGHGLLWYLENMVLTVGRVKSTVQILTLLCTIAFKYETGLRKIGWIRNLKQGLIDHTELTKRGKKRCYGVAASFYFILLCLGCGFTLTARASMNTVFNISVVSSSCWSSALVIIWFDHQCPPNHWGWPSKEPISFVKLKKSFLTPPWS